MRMRNRGKNIWQLRWELGRDDHGQRRQKTETFHGNKKSAEQRWREVQATLDGHPATAWAREDLTCGDYLLKWLAYLATTELRPTTLASYRFYVERYLRPALGTAKLTQLTPLHLQEVLQQWQTQPGHSGHGLARSTVRRMLIIMQRALTQAVHWEMIPANPARGIRLRPATPPEIHWWTPAAAQQFLAVSDTHRLAVAFRLALFGGLRMGEVLGLRWQDVDWAQQTLTIRQIVTVLRDSVQVSAPKTAKSQRTIKVDQQILGALRARQHTQKLERLAKGWPVTDYVITTRKGTICWPHTINDILDRLIQEADVPRIRFHDLRHTHATWLAQAGVHPKVIADRLGHTRIGFTLDTYVHSDLADQEKALQLLAPFGPD